MWKITGNLLCLCLLALPLIWAEDTKEAACKDANNSVSNQGNNQQPSGRRRISLPQGNQIPKVKLAKAWTPVRRCVRQAENCSAHVPCCDPCASCRCRLFNTICHCWRMGLKCLKRT